MKLHPIILFFNFAFFASPLFSEANNPLNHRFEEFEESMNRVRFSGFLPQFGRIANWGRDVRGVSNFLDEKSPTGVNQ